MGTRRAPPYVKLIVSIFSRDVAKIDDTIRRLVKHYGPVDFRSELLPFNHTDYYLKEMGAPLHRSIISFSKLRPVDGLYKAKLFTNAIEHSSMKDARRLINIDPGYIDLSKLVLFSTKDYTHRLHICKGIYAEVTLYYKDRSFNGWPWTYPDYGSPAYLRMFETIRELYKREITGEKCCLKKRAS